MAETSTPDRINSTYPILDIGGIIVWDLTEFDKTSEGELLNNRIILQPTKKDDTHVTFCKCDFNVKVLIHENATADDIIIGWAKVSEELKLGRLVNLFLKDFLHNFYLTRNLHEEPYTILLLRLVYWYYKSSLVSESFRFKRIEIKQQLIKGLLNEREKIEKQIDAAENGIIQMNALVSQLESVILGFIKNPVNWELKQKSKNYRDAWFKAVWNITSELLFAGICAENDFKVTFAPPPPDFIVDGYPIQVKSLNIRYKLAEAKILRKKLVDASQITFDSVITMILDAINNKLDEVDNALERGAKIVFFNGTSNKSGGYLGELYLDEENPFSLRRSLTNSIQLVKADYSFIPLIFFETGIRLQYYINTLPFKVRIIDVNGRKRVDRTKEITIIK